MNKYISGMHFPLIVLGCIFLLMHTCYLMRIFLFVQLSVLSNYGDDEVPLIFL
ncbi:hypothetical protein QJS04_geneDACA001637 [Acorus gramineus]|uniref:Uncharacterized protein n=1 Tax=Acorus gramineus TaxID=55184 RepID=A0AAV9BH26_ACOGR|nr:hypothetical protein QJS04_geneDACA001637 [Acorus gramineus]